MPSVKNILILFLLIFICYVFPKVIFADTGPLGGTIQTGQSGCASGKYDTCLDPKAACVGGGSNYGNNYECELVKPDRDICEGHDPTSGNVETGICYYSTSSTPKFTDCSTITSLDYHQTTAYHKINDDVQPCGANYGSFVVCCAPNDQPSPVAPPPPCVTGPDGACHQVDTGLGVIQVDPGAIVGSLFNILLGISGGVALILIMISGYRMMFSSGDPEKLKEAREMLTSAIIGLLFIIFAVVILQVIGVDILHLPGLNR